MIGKPGAQMVDRYEVDLKLGAAKMSESPEVLIKDVAESLCIHPFMLSKWRRQVREGVLVGILPKVDPDSLAELKRLREVEQKFKRLQMEHDLRKKAIRFASKRRAKSSPFVQANRKTHAIQMMCAYFKVSRSGFYAWQGRDPSSRQLRDEGLIEQVKRIHADSRGDYGSPRVQHALAQQGTAVSRGTVARVMRRARLQGRSARLYRRSRVGQKAFFTSIPNTVRAIQPGRINQVWVGDVTYLRVSGQWRDLAVVMDKFSRRIIGWSLSRNQDAALTLDAVNHALRNRKPESGLHFHSDRGIEYAPLPIDRSCCNAVSCRA